MEGIGRPSVSPPRHIDRLGQAIGVPFFFDPGQAEAVRRNPAELNPVELEERTVLYWSALRATVECRDEAERAGRLRFIAEQLTMINAVQRPNPPCGLPLRRHQSGLLDRVPRFMQARPLREHLTEVAKSPDRSIREIFTKGCTIVSPTGSGKTVMEGYTMNQLGIGSPIGETGERLRALLVTNAELIPQFMGETGDDTLRRTAPGLRLSAFYSERKDPSGDAILTTKPMFVRHFRNGRFAGIPVHALLVDEVHHLTEPQFYEVFTEHWRGPAFGFTATPAYHPNKDVRRILPFVLSRGGMLAHIRDRIINGAQLFTFVIEPRHNAALAATLDLDKPSIRKKAGEFLLNQAVVDFAAELVGSGRRGIIFGSKGEESEHAKLLARMLNGKLVPTEGGRRRIDARPIGVFQSHWKNQEAIRAYESGECDVLTTVGKGGEGLNLPFNFVLHAVRTTSSLRMRQRNGRGTRLNPEWPITVYGEFFVPSLEEEGPFVTLWDDFELTRVEQGRCIGAGGQGLDYSGSWQPGHSDFPRGAAARYADEADPPLDKAVDLASLSEQLQAYCQVADRKLVSELTLAPDINLDPPRHYIPVTTLQVATGRNRKDITWLLRYFERSGAWERQEDGDEVFMQYYPPEALPFLLYEHPLPPRSEPTERSIRTLTERYNSSERFLRSIIGVELAKGKEYFRGIVRSRRDVEYIVYGEQVIAELDAFFESLPVADAADRTISQVVTELGCAPNFIYANYEELGIRPRAKRSNVTGRAGGYIEGRDVERLRIAFYSVPLAEADDLSSRDISDCLGGRRANAGRSLLSPEEYPHAKFKRTIEHPSTALFFVPRAVAIHAIERLLPVALPPYLVPRRVIQKIIDGSKKTLDIAIAKSGYQGVSLKLPGQSGPSTALPKCYPWMLLRDLECNPELSWRPGEPLGRRPGVPPIDYDRLPHSPEEVNEATSAAARAIYERYLPPDQLAIPPTMEEALQYIEELIDRRTRLRRDFLAVGDRAARWEQYVGQGALLLEPDQQPESTPPPPQKPASPPPALSAAAIAEKAQVRLEEAEAVIRAFAAEYASRMTVRSEIIGGLKTTVYAGAYLDAVLMTLIGRTGEQIAHIVGMPDEIVVSYLQERFETNQHGRYGLRAMQAALAEFRRPPSRNYLPVEDLAQELGRHEEEVIAIALRHGGRVDYFYDAAAQRSPFLPASSVSLVRTIHAAEQDASHWPEAGKGGIVNRYEIARLGGRELTDIDRWLAEHAKPHDIRWCRVRQPELAHGARVLPHYPLVLVAPLLAKRA